MALLEKIRQNLNKPAETTDLGGQTDTVRGLLRAKTGKEATPGGGPRQSSIQEKMAERQTQLGGEQIQQKGQLLGQQQQEQQADIAQRAAQQAQQQQQAQKDIAANLQRQTDSLLDQFSRGEKTLDNLQDMADMEQVGFNVRLENKQYIDALQQEGKKKRLDDKFGFKRELSNQIMDNNRILLENDLDFDNVIKADIRTYQEELAKLKTDDIIQMAEEGIKASNARAQAEGIAGIASAGVEAYANSDSFFGKQGKGEP